MNQFQILGVPIEFPYSQIYPSQKAVIANSIRAFKNQENALLESPTGTGKALALLSSSLAYQKYVIDNEPKTPTDNFNEYNPNPASTENLPNNTIDPPRIFFTSRTHQQLKQLINEYKSLNYHPSMIILGGRKKLCLNKAVLQSNDPSTECVKVMKNKKCPFKMEAGIPYEFRSGGTQEKFDIEDLIEYGRKHYRCPYHLSLVVLSKASLVFCPYNYILDPMIKTMLELTVKNSIVVIDEAHNVENVCRESGTFRVTRTDFLIALRSLSSLKNELVSEDPDLADLVVVIEFIQSIHNWFEENLNMLKFMKKRESIKTVETVFMEWKLTEKNWPYYDVALNKIINKVVNNKSHSKKENSENGSQESIENIEDLNIKSEDGLVTVKTENNAPISNVSLLRKFFNFFVLAFKNNMDNFDKFQIVLTVSEDLEDNLLVACLDPSVIFSCVSNEAHSIVLASGTLSPLSTFSSELGAKFPIQLSANHIIDKDQVESYIITNSSDGTPFTSVYQSLIQNKDVIIKNLGSLFMSLLPEIPGGALLFLPSYKFLNDLVDGWKKSGIWKQLNCIKKVFVEESRTINTTYQKYQKTISNQHGGFLIGVCRGNMSEGMDFKNEQARAVFIFGIPFPNSLDIEVKLKRSYNDQLVNEYFSQSSQSSSQSSQSNSFPFGSQVDFGSQGNYPIPINKCAEGKPISGSEWYESQAFRSVFQAIGRCIRHKSDYGTIFLIDQRFQNFVPKFPRWVQSSFVHHNGINNIKQNLRVFYQKMQIKYPQTVPFARGQQMMFECSSCKALIVDVQSIDFDQSELTNRKGFIDLIDAGANRNCIFFSRNSKIKLFTEPDLTKNIWKQEDMSVYNLICCPKCGQKLGAFIQASTLPDSLYTEGYLFSLMKLAIHEETKKTVQTKPPTSPKRKKKSQQVEDKTQLKIMFQKIVK